MSTREDILSLAPWNNAPLWSRLHIRHGHASRLNGRRDSPTYTSWQAMRSRCRYELRDPEKKYVNRGIAHDPAWNSFERFLSDMGERPAGTTLDRVDNQQGYSKENCKWSTPTQQARNRRNTRLTYASAVEMTVKRLLGATCRELSAEYGCSESLPREIAKGRTWKDAAAEAHRIVEATNAKSS